MAQLIDLLGHKFGDLVVVARASPRNAKTFWGCRCDCGTFVEVNASSLKRGYTKSCGCALDHAAARRRKELAGQRFGRWLVLERTSSPSDSRSHWRCRCDCGTVKAVSATSLRSGATHSCGCLTVDVLRAGRADLTGQRFNRWTVLRFWGHTPTKKAMWECRCDCGSLGQVEGSNLKGGASKSCGCLTAELNKARSIHSLSGSPERGVYYNMLSRCSNENRKDYKNYGGRGIRPCAAWETPPVGFLRFYEILGARPSSHHTLDRIDNNRGYDCGACADCRGRCAPLNCRWLGRTGQARNKRRLRMLKHPVSGEEMCLTAWAMRLGVSPAALTGRLQRGVPLEQALTGPW
jgi:hypothetical protein